MPLNRARLLRGYRKVARNSVSLGLKRNARPHRLIGYRNLFRTTTADRLPSAALMLPSGIYACLRFLLDLALIQLPQEAQFLGMTSNVIALPVAAAEQKPRARIEAFGAQDFKAERTRQAVDRVKGEADRQGISDLCGRCAGGEH